MAEFDLDELDRLHAAATPGPWVATCSFGVWQGPLVEDEEDSASAVKGARGQLFQADEFNYEEPAADDPEGRGPDELARVDEEWLAAIHNAYPSLSAELRQSRARVAELEELPVFGVDPEDSQRLLALRNAIDERLGWRDQASEDAGDYVARVAEVGERIRNLEAELARFKAVARKIPIVRTGEPGSEQWLTCLGCKRSGSDNCAPDCWVYELEGLTTDEG
jgi:hypothetical protein